MSNDVTIRRIRRHLETINVTPPSAETLEEIVDWIDRSDTYYSIRRHQDIVDAAVAEATNGDLDQEKFDEGYDQALADIRELGSGETAVAATGGSAA